jgi:hypothetical protein
VYVVPEHDSPTQTVLAAHSRQAPPPSHMPSAPQVDCAVLAHSLSGSVPAVIVRHSPLACPVFALAHAMHALEHPDSQQTPSTQLPLAQSPAAPQGRPFAFCATHAPAAQKLPLVQSAPEPHDVLHDVAPQT